MRNSHEHRCRPVGGIVLAASAVTALAMGYAPHQQSEAREADAIKALIAEYAAVVNVEPVDLSLPRTSG